MTHKVRVVHITETFVTGVYSYIKDLSTKLDEDDRFENIVIYSDNRKGRIIEDFSKHTKLLTVDMVREINFSKDRKSFLEIYRILKELEPDILHVHSSKAGFLGRLVKIFLRKKPKLYYTAHGFSFLRTDVSNLKRKFYFVLEKLITILSGSTIVACGDTEFTEAKRLGKSVLIRNGVDMKSVIEYHKLPQMNDKISIGILGRISYPRNPTLFNQIAMHFNNVDFFWIGGGELEHCITAPNIKVTGWFLNKTDGFDYLSSIDIYLQTSLWEGLPIALLEAMAFKKPVVASKVIGNVDAVVHKETGFLFDNFDEACSYIQVLIDDEVKRKEYGKAGFTRCLELFDTNKNFAKLLSIYAS